MQALIAAVGSIVFQAIAQGFFPRFHVYHTSDHVFGQVYIPFINYMLMVLTLIVVGTFKTSASLGQAYGEILPVSQLVCPHSCGDVRVIGSGLRYSVVVLY